MTQRCHPLFFSPNEELVLHFSMTIFLDELGKFHNVNYEAQKWLGFWYRPVPVFEINTHFKCSGKSFYRTTTTTYCSVSSNFEYMLDEIGSGDRPAT